MTDAQSAPSADPAATAAPKPWGMDMPTFLMLLHLSQLASFVIPLAGLVLPIVMWATNKDLDPRIDAHGKVVLNWILSAVIYGIVSALLCLILVGFFFLFALGICSLVFCILGGVKANGGILWKYPLSIPFFKVAPV